MIHFRWESYCQFLLLKCVAAIWSTRWQQSRLADDFEHLGILIDQDYNRLQYSCLTVNGNSQLQYTRRPLINNQVFRLIASSSDRNDWRTLICQFWIFQLQLLGAENMSMLLQEVVLILFIQQTFYFGKGNPQPTPLAVPNYFNFVGMLDFSSNRTPDF